MSIILLIFLSQILLTLYFSTFVTLFNSTQHLSNILKIPSCDQKCFQTAFLTKCARLARSQSVKYRDVLSENFHVGSYYGGTSCRSWYHLKINSTDHKWSMSIVQFPNRSFNVQPLFATAQCHHFDFSREGEGRSDGLCPFSKARLLQWERE